MSPSIKIRKADIHYALNHDRRWDLCNEVLYRLCKEHPRHRMEQEILAKITIIGRTYAAAIERRKKKKNTRDGDANYEERVVRMIQQRPGIDDWLSALRKNHATSPTDILVIHKKTTDLFKEISKLEKRSLASKYLHFHRPDLFFIYDSRARRGIYAVTPWRTPRIECHVKGVDKEYHAFLSRCLWLRDEIRRRYGRLLTPRQLDKVLLRVCERITG